MRQYLRHLLGPIALAAAISACTPSAPAPTAHPTAAPATVTLAPPTATPSAPAALSLADTLAYRHPSGAFAVDVPMGWALSDESQPDELIMVWTGPGRGAAVIVNLFEADPGYDQARLGAILTAYLERSFGEERDYSAGVPEADGRGGATATWGFTRGAGGGAEATLAGVSRIVQREGTVAIVSVLLPAGKRDKLAEGAEAILASLAIRPE